MTCKHSCYQNKGWRPCPLQHGTVTVTCTTQVHGKMMNLKCKKASGGLDRVRTRTGRGAGDAGGTALAEARGQQSGASGIRLERWTAQHMQWVPRDQEKLSRDGPLEVNSGWAHFQLFILLDCSSKVSPLSYFWPFPTVCNWKMCFFVICTFRSWIFYQRVNFVFKYNSVITLMYFLFSPNFSKKIC